jgi:protease-4
MRGAGIVVGACALAGCVYAPVSLGDMGDGKIEERTLLEADTGNKIALVQIDGEIDDSATQTLGFTTREGTTARVKELLDVAKKDDDVKGLIVRINSPGGGVTASDIVYHELKAWKTATGKPVVALLMDVAASGGYYIAQASDRIVAHPTCVTGSIGVVALFVNVEGLSKKIGVEVTTIKSGVYKDIGSPFRPMEESERKLLKNLIDEMYGQFVSVVADGRKSAGLSREEILKLADGRVFSAADARAARLVDSVGYFEDAVTACKDLAHVKDAKVVTYTRRGFGGAGKGTVYSRAQAEGGAGSPLVNQGPFESNVIKVDADGLARGNRPVFNYLWVPD